MGPAGLGPGACVELSLLVATMSFLLQDPVVLGVVAVGGLCEVDSTAAKWPAALWV